MTGGADRAASPARSRWPRRLVDATAAVLALWGLIHVLGGLSLLVASTAEGIDTLAPGADAPAPADPGQGAAGLLRFHALNVGLAGAAVLVLAVAWWRSGARWTRDVALALAVGFDVGLIAFLVLPGLLPASQGLVGPVLAGLALVGAVAGADRRAPERIEAPTAAH